MKEQTARAVNLCAYPSDLKITDMRFVDIDGAPKHLTLMKLYTNQGLVGFGEVRDAASKTYALMLKSRILGENPCNVDKIFRRIKQFGGPSRQGGGVSAIEMALWDLAGKAYGVPAYQLLGGKFRDKIRMYCDTDVEGRHTGADMGHALKKRMDAGFTYLKMDLGIGMLLDVPGALNAPLGYLDDVQQYAPAILNVQRGSINANLMRKRSYEIFSTAHPFTGIHLTEKGLDVLEEYMQQVRSIIGYEVPLAIDHFGHVCVEDCIRFASRMVKYNIAWMEDMIPWQHTEQYQRLAQASCIPVCTGEDIYLKENFLPLMKTHGVSVIHPDVMTCGGMLEMKKIADCAQENGVALAIHMAGSPIACMASVHAAAASPENLLAMEFHSVDIPWWPDIVKGLDTPLIHHGYIDVPEKPGLGIEDLNDEILAEHLHKTLHGLWEPTDSWDQEWSNDRIWS